MAKKTEAKAAKIETQEDLEKRTAKEAEARKDEANRTDVIPPAGTPGGPYPNTRECYAPRPDEMKKRVQDRKDAIAQKEERAVQAKQMTENETHGLYPFGAGGLGVSGAIAKAHKKAERDAAAKK